MHLSGMHVSGIRCIESQDEKNEAHGHKTIMYLTSVLNA